MARYKEPQVTLQVTFKVATNDAILVAYEGDEQWVPRSPLSFFTDRMVDDWDRNQEVEITVAEWLAKKKGWV